VKIREFASYDEFVEAAVGLLGQALRADGGILVPGGRTPAPVYARLADEPVAVSSGAYLMLSDERAVPAASPLRNERLLAPLVASLGLAPSRLLRVPVGDAETAARDYDRTLSAFFDSSALRLAILGVGSDGHTASLFPGRDGGTDGDRFAVAVTRDDGPDRVSVTPRTLQRAGRIVFWVTGADKADVVRRMCRSPAAVVASRVVDGKDAVDVWYCQEGRGEER
jgi:6-phosphogluconolactonase